MNAITKSWKSTASLPLLGAAAIWLGAAPYASALVFTFAGVVTAVPGPDAVLDSLPSGTVEVGDGFTVTIEFPPSPFPPADSNPSPNVGSYNFTSPDPDAGESLLKIAEFGIASTPYLHQELTVFNDSMGRDAVHVGAEHDFYVINFLVEDSSATALSSDQRPGLAEYDISQWECSSLTIEWFGDVDPAPRWEGVIVGLECDTDVVPESGSPVGLGALATGVLVVLRRRWKG